MRTSTAAMMHALAAPCSQHGLGEEQSNLQYRAGGSKSFPYWQHVNPPAPRTRPPSFDTISRSHCGRLAFTFFPPLHLNCSLGVCSCSHERALQSQMCEETVSKLGFCLSKFSSCTRCLWQMGLRLWFEFQSRATNKFHRRPPPPKVPSGTKRSVTIFDNEIETETFVLNSVISKPQTSLKWGELKEYSEITTSVDRRHNGRAASPLLTLFA